MCDTSRSMRHVARRVKRHASSGRVTRRVTSRDVDAASAPKTPGQLVRQLREQLGADGKAISQAELAAMIGAPSYQTIIPWEKGRRAISEKYAAALADLSQQTDEPHLAADYLGRSGEMSERLAAIERALVELADSVPTSAGADVGELWVRRLQARDDEIAEQLAKQSALLQRLSDVSVTLTDVAEGLKAQIEALRDAVEDLQAGRRPA
jgi:DNA-binding XRE family transcriptional regulator/uncharacterized coiled-coil protein SlyX